VTEERVVLIADDDADLRGLVVYRLESVGFRVLEAEDGEQAIALALEAQPDVAIVDLMMPVKNGIEVTRALRADERTAGTRVILLTSRAQEADIASGFEAGADDYVTKPFSPQELQARVNAVLARR
jgi:DNA-binding response OmpR family regulator